MSRTSMTWFARDAWFAVDKIDHIVYAIAFWLLLSVFVDGAARLFGFAAGSIGIELLELFRFWAWVQRGRPQPEPILCDPVSYKDLVADAIGAGVAMWCLARLLG